MMHRERVSASMHHEEPDRPPLLYRDVPEVEARLCRGLGLADREALLRRFDIDFRWITPQYEGPPLLDERAGRRRDIWGVDEPRGTPEDVRRGVRELLDILARGGGYFVAPTHNLQSDIPTENIVATYEAAREWRPS